MTCKQNQSQNTDTRKKQLSQTGRGKFIPIIWCPFGGYAIENDVKVVMKKHNDLQTFSGALEYYRADKQAIVEAIIKASIGYLKRTIISF